MNKIICPRCGAQNAPEMAFCTNCGQSFAASPAGHQPNVQLPKVSPHESSRMPTAVLPTGAGGGGAAPKKMSRGLLFTLLGCGSLCVLSLAGLILVGIFINTGQTVQVNGNFIGANHNGGSANKNSFSSNSVNNISNINSVEQLNSSTLDEIRSLKQVGAFRQTDVKDVPAGDFYPSASEAVQVTYQNGKQTVMAIAAQFQSNEAALADFQARMQNVTENGGKIYNKTNQSGSQGAAYKFKEYYYIEVCGEAVCWRNYSSELNAVRMFAVNFPNGRTQMKK